MTRSQALEDLKGMVKKLESTFQGEDTKEDKDAKERMRLIDDCFEVEQINDCIDCFEELYVWLDGQIAYEDEFHNDSLPDEGFPGFRAGE